MRRRKAIWAAAAGVALVLFARPAQALFGLGDIVFDPTSYGELVTSYSELVAQLEQLIETYKVIKHSQLALGDRHAWLALAQQLQNSVVRDINGESAAISRVVNGQGGSSTAAWANGTLRLSGTGFLMSEQPGSSVHLSNAASVAMTDAFGADAIQTVGDLRQLQTQISQAIEALQAQEEELGDDDNTPVAQQNVTNAALMQLIKLQQKAATLQASILEQVSVTNTWHRNAVAEATNFYDQTVTYRSTSPADYGGGASTTLSTFLMP